MATEFTESYFFFWHCRKCNAVNTLPADFFLRVGFDGKAACIRCDTKYDLAHLETEKATAVGSLGGR